jgi:hypothetical protein
MPCAVRTVNGRETSCTWENAENCGRVSMAKNNTHTCNYTPIMSRAAADFINEWEEVRMLELETEE